MTTIHLFVLSVLLVLCGCADTQTVQLDSTGRHATTHVDVYNADQGPIIDEATRVKLNHSKTIAELSWRGPQGDELRAERYFIKQAQRHGGNAVVIEREVGPQGFSWGPLGGGTSREYLFKAKVIVYEP